MTTLRQIAQIASRAESTLFYDALGAAALAVMLISALYLPALF